MYSMLLKRVVGQKASFDRKLPVSTEETTAATLKHAKMGVATGRSINKVLLVVLFRYQLRA